MAGLPVEVTDLALNILSKLEQNDYDFLDTDRTIKIKIQGKRSKKM